MSLMVIFLLALLIAGTTAVVITYRRESTDKAYDDGFRHGYQSGRADEQRDAWEELR